jgi:hypothetical protein
MTDDQWRNRPLSVTVRELCPKCNELKTEVQERLFYAYGTLKYYSCLECYNTQKAKGFAC